MAEAFDRAVFIGESLALFGEVQRLAYEEYARLSSERAASGVLGTEARRAPTPQRDRFRLFGKDHRLTLRSHS